MPEQAAHDAPVFVGEAVRREQVEHDVVVITGVERDVVAARVGDGADNVDGLVPVERRDLYGDDVLDLGEPSPERIRQDPAADGGLKVKADDRDDVGDGAGVGGQLVFG